MFCPVSPIRVKKPRLQFPAMDNMDNADDIELMVIELHQQTIDPLNRMDYAQIKGAPLR